MTATPIDIVRSRKTVPSDEDETNAYMLVARYRKARKLADNLLKHGAGVELAEQLGTYEAGRELAAEAAGTRLPSSTTWALVVELVREARS